MHWGNLLNSGAGLFIIEATGVTPEGRITPVCLGLWDDRTEAALKDKLTKAFLDLNKATPEGKEILELQRATRFIATKADNYKGIEAAGRSAGLLK